MKTDNHNSAIAGFAEVLRNAPLSPHPKWMNIAVAAAWSGLSVRLIEELCSTREVVSSNVVRDGNTRGKRLVLVESLDSFIQAGVERAPAKLAANVQKRGGCQ